MEADLRTINWNIVFIPTISVTFCDYLFALTAWRYKYMQAIAMIYNRYMLLYVCCADDILVHTCLQSWTWIVKYRISFAMKLCFLDNVYSLYGQHCAMNNNTGNTMQIMKLTSIKTFFEWDVVKLSIRSCFRNISGMQYSNLHGSVYWIDSYTLSMACKPLELV